MAIENHIPFLELSSALSDVTAGCADNGQRRISRCEMFPAGADAQLCVAAWHAALHWLRYNDEPIVTCLLDATVRKAWPLVTEASTRTSLGELLASIQGQWMAESSGWLDLYDATHAGLLDQLRCLALRLHDDRDVNELRAEFEIVATASGWEVDCAAGRFTEAYQHRVLALWRQMISRMIEHPAELLSEQTFDGNVVAGPVAPIAGNLVERFLIQVARQSHKTAVSDGPVGRTFAELNDISVAWARKLEEAGVAKGDCVGVAFGRNWRMIAAQLAVLRLGAVFVPMDAGQPVGRLHAMADDTNMRVILGEAACEAPLATALPHLQTLIVDEIPVAPVSLEEYDGRGIQTDDLAYVVFTSGSTGRPKGVKVSHGNLVNFVEHLSNYVGNDDVLTQFAPFTFDASVAEIHVCLLNGGRLVILPAELIDNPERLQDYMTQQRVTFAAFPPQYARHLSPSRLPHLKTLMTAGSAPDHELVSRWQPHLNYVNAYGPTETTILSTAWHAHRVPEAHEPIVIGSPIANTEVRVVNRFNQALPRGVVGELHIGGAGVTHGYISEQELTRERFIQSERTRWYRSGDLSCFNDADELIFAGRVDAQVKLRGHRIEPGEVETALLRIRGVRQAAVLVVDLEAASQLIACCVGERQSEESLREQLRQLVPAWAVPNRFLWIESLPLTANGKTDYKQLRRMCESVEETVREHEYGSQLEAEIARIWGNVLQRPNVSRDDNFIHLGGDSLTALVVMAALKRLGYSVSASQLIARPRLADFAAFLQAAGRSSTRDYSTCSGVAPLSPIQAWFFDLRLQRPGPFCQTLMFESTVSLAVERLQMALAKLIGYHDQLRASFVLDAGKLVSNAGWQQQVLEEKQVAAPRITHIEVSAQELDAVSERCRHALADELDIECAPLFRVALLSTATRSRVVFVLHHLIVDTVSHGILLDDLRQIYERVDEDVERVLPGKSLSYLDWSQRLLSACSERSQEQLESWLPTLQRTRHADRLPSGADTQAGGSLNVVETRLSAIDTTRLIEGASACYRQSPEEIVLAATYLALARTFALRSVAIDIEWHGRDEQLAGPEGIDRTVGWFTSVHPFCMEVPANVDLAAWLIELKETRAASPDRGRHFYTLRYLSRDEQVRAAFADYKAPQVLFNFSGIVQRQQAGWRTVPVPAIEMGEGNADPYALSVESELRGGELIISFYHASATWSVDVMNALSKHMTACLQELSAHCADSLHARWTPSDFPLAALTQQQLDDLPRSVSAVYPLTDMQRTMVRHSQTYQVLMCYRVPRRFDEGQWKRAVADWVARHDCLRTYIREHDGDRAVQVVLDSIDLPLTIHRVAPGEAEGFCRELMEQSRQRPVQLGQAPLFHVDTVSEGVGDDAAGSFRFVLTIHHIIHDGWSIELLLSDLWQSYRFHNGETDRQPLAPLASVAQIVTEQRRLRESAQWRDYWANLPWQSEACELPERARSSALPAQHSDTKLHLSTLDPTLVEAARASVQSLGGTLNGVWLSAYVCLLRYLGGRQQIRCGVIQSGRMEEIVGVETITGCCVNTLPLVLNIESERTLSAIVTDVNTQLGQMRAAGAFPLSDIQQLVRSKIDGDMFSTLFNIESHLYGSRAEAERLVLENGYESTNYQFIFGLIERLDGGYGVRIGYDANRYDLATVERWIEIYATCVWRLIENADLPWNRVQLLPRSVHRKIVSQWNATRRPYPHDRTVAELFREQAARVPEHPALIYKDEQLSYRELDARSDQLARLLQAKGVKPESIVGLVAERSLQGVVAILAIFKAGGAYVPLDPKYPAARIRHMVQDVGCRLALVQRRALSNVIPADLGVDAVYLDEPIRLPADAPAAVSTAEHHSRQLGYVMYTSGSTGNPKGVMIEQRSIVRLVKGTADIPFSAGDRILLTSAPGFDVTTFEIWSALLNGLTLGIVDEDTLLDPERLAAEIRAKRITLLWLIAPLFNRLVQEKPTLFEGVKYLMLGGDALSPAHVRIARQATPGLQIINGYGPTENTSFSTYHFLSDADADCIPIGRPLTNSTAYVVNRDGQLLPPGVNGELIVGGPGVARGYLNQPELTRDKFIADPFSSEIGASLYRTGDLVRWREDGLIDFLGRIDHQVKIRGFRVELGEIENAIAAHDAVKQVIVTIRKQDGREQLIGYVVPKQALVNEADARTTFLESVVSGLRSRLPEYMVPTAFVTLAEMPRNANGKIDRKRLPEPDVSAYAHSTFAAPANDTERTLWSIWKEILGVDTFGVSDDFFAVGGDSIMAIQVVARAAKHNITLTTRQLIEERTIRQLASKAMTSDRSPAAVSTAAVAKVRAAVAHISGEQRLLPGQLLSLRASGADQNHEFVWIALPANVSKDGLHQALQAVVERHDALRLKFRETAAGWVAQYRPYAPEQVLVEENLDAVAREWRSTFIDDAIEGVRASLDLKQGRLWKCLWVCEGTSSRLLWVIHKLIVDATSWRLLLGDLLTALVGQELLARTSSLQEWGARLHELAFDPAPEEKEFWLRQLEAPASSLTSTGADEPALEADAQRVEVSLGATETAQLLHHANSYYDTQTRHLLIAALSRALGEMLDSDSIRIDLESTGRGAAEELDLSETVGLFVARYPVHFSNVRADLGRHLRRVREQLVSVPRDGIGYGVLALLAQDEDLHAARSRPEFREPDVLLADSAALSLDQAIGRFVTPHRPRTHALRIDTSMRADGASFCFDFDHRQLDEQVVTALAHRFVRVLREIIEHCSGGFQESIAAPFPLSGLGRGKVVELRRSYAHLGDVYPCTAMQQGLLLYSSRDPGTGAYVTQLRIDLEGIDAARLRASWQELLARHEVLRTAFVDVGQSVLMQVVSTQVDLPWREADVRDRASDETLNELSELERVRPFDMTCAPLMRVLLARLTDTAYRLAWTHHHALIDGWSMVTLIRELFENYATAGKDSASRARVAPYKDYIDWLQGRDEQVATRYWREYLSDAQGTADPVAQWLSERMSNNGADSAIENRQAVHTLDLSVEHTKRLLDLAKNERVSLATLILGAWGLLLSKYSGEERVLFGYSTSGRPAALPGVESMVGLFINSLPLQLRVQGEPRLRDWLREIQQRQLDHEEQGFLALADIQRIAGLRPGRTPFESLVVVENFPLDRSRFSGRSWDGARILDIHGTGRSSFALNLVAYPGERLRLDLAYQRGLFDDASSLTLLRHLAQILIGFSSSGEQTIAQVPLLGSDEQARAVHTWNDTRKSYRVDRTLPELLEQRVRARRNALALVASEERWTYTQLGARARTLSKWLVEMGVAPGHTVALSLPRSADLIAAMIALLRLGAPYVPVALDCPADRRAFIAADAGIRWTITRREHADCVETPNVTALFLDECAPARRAKRSMQAVAPTPETTAYVIYTSGTTGHPKGVMISHRNLINFCCWTIDAGLLGAGDAVTQFAPYTFDASAGEIFGTLLAGGELHLIADSVVQDPRAMERYIAEHEIRFAAFPPPYLQQLDPQRVPEGMTILTAGSAPPIELVRRWSQRVRYINGYGPTETTILSSAWMYDPAQIERGSLTIGRPISNTSIYIVDRLGQLCPPGMTGEILIGGDGVAQGYLNRAELTHEKFISDPWIANRRLYRTGDLGRWLPDGQVEFVGRRDRQVKLRGYRIELGEIETRMRQHPQVKDATLAVRGEGASAQLFAWVVFDSATFDATSVEALREFLSKSLPDYMLPQAIVPIEQVPLTPNGKVDEKALPQPENVVRFDGQHVAPRTQAEQRLVDIWAAVLKLRPGNISVTANFFELGGHSLLAMRVISRIREELAVDVAVADMFAHPVLEAQAVIVSGATHRALPPVVPVKRDEPLPLSFAQQRLWFMEQLEGIGETYHIPGVLRLMGVLDRSALGRALDRIVARHEILRTTFELVDGEPVQRIGAVDRGFALVEHDLRGRVDAQSTLRQIMVDEVKQPFDFERGPLVRGRLVTLGEQEYMLLLTVHHIVMDGWSMGVLTREFNTLYAAYRDGKEDPLPPLAIQYGDYAVWQRRWLAGDVLRAQCEYWRRALEGAPPLLELPTDHPRPSRQQFKGELYHFELDESLTAGLKALSQRQGTTMFMTLLAGWSVMLGRLSGQDDVVVGAPVANRTPMEVEPLIGCFVNAIAIRTDLSAAPTVGELLQRVKQQVAGAQQHQQVPFEQVVDALQPLRSLAYNAIFQVWLNWQNMEVDAIDLGELQVTPAEAPLSVSKFDLRLSLVEAGPRIAGSIEYATALFERHTVERHIGCLRGVLQAMVADEQQLITRLPMMSEAERRRVLVEFNDTRTEYPHEHCIHVLFEAQVTANPRAPAVEYDGTQLTYGQLNRRANQIAHELISLGVRPDDRVAICVERSVEMVIGILGILKAGGAYVPLDPAYPAERLALLLEDCAPVALLMQHAAPGNLASLAAAQLPMPVVALDENDERVSTQHVHNPDARSLNLTSRNLAYVIYTSGSTGQPKGVMVEHTSAVNFWQVLSRSTHRGCRRGSRIGLNATYTFDMSLKGLLQLLSGHCVVVIPQAIRADGEAMVKFIEDHRIDSLDSTPSQLDALLRAGLLDRCAHPPVSILLGGEPILPAMWQTLRDADIHFFNMYGPTECTVDASIGSIRQSQGGPSIGKPIANTQIYVLDAHLQPVPIGVIGEMYLAGVQVARGYLNRAELTAERFLEDPFADRAGARMYKTGDLARYRPGGTLEYAGRRDFQVKIRGFRIELGEIESCLQRHAAVREAVVVARARGEADKQLIAYVTLKTEADSSELRAHLSAQLPEHMVPSVLVRLETLPLTRNGKVDREALPEPESIDLQQTAYEAPLSGTERLVASVWQELLGVPRVGRNDSFFDLGGNSILLIRMLNELRRHQLILTLTDAYRLRTLAACSEAVTASTYDPLQWLKSRGWVHELHTLRRGERELRVLLIESRGKAHRRDFQVLLAHVPSSSRPDYILICEDVAHVASNLQRQGLSALGLPEPPDAGDMTADLARQVHIYESVLTKTQREAEYPFSPIQRNMMHWNARGDFQCLAVEGWYGAVELQRAFQQLSQEQDLLRSIPDGAQANWELLPKGAVRGATLPVIDLRAASEEEFTSLFTQLADQLLSLKKQSALPYLGVWVSASDVRHYLVLAMDHLIWDGASAVPFKQRLAQFLTSSPEPLVHSYRDYVDVVSRDPDPAALQLLAQRFEHRELARTMAATLQVLTARAAMPRQGVRFMAPVDRSMSPAEQLFGAFKRWIAALTGLERFAMVFNHHGRRIGGREYFDHVGLFLDKVPFAVDADTRLEDLSAGTAYLHDRGWTYLGLEHALSNTRTPVLPPLDLEILFNFQAHGHSENELRDLVIDAEHIAEKLALGRGVIFEASVENGVLLGHCSFRGERGDLESLRQCLPGAQLMDIDGSEGAA